MKFVPFLFALTLLASCGKSGSGGGSGAQNQEADCSINSVAVNCETIEGDGAGVDLLESRIESPVRITGTEIVFLADKSTNAQGRRISCPTQVSNGEAYSFNLRGNSLDITTKAGSFTFTRLNSGADLNGTWVWKGYNGATNVYTIRTLTVINNNRAFLKNSCEQ